MSRQRTVMLSLVTVFAASMFTTAGASAAGPFWHTGTSGSGTKLTQGLKGLKLQSKGVLRLSSEIKAKPSNVKIIITCNNSTSDGTIEGQGAVKQGQAKGIVTYTSCKTEITELPNCKAREPIKTGQLKSYLATGSVQGLDQIVEVFEPNQPQGGGTPEFTTIILEGTCGVLAGPHVVTGFAVAILVPQEQITQEGLLNFPIIPITTVKHEGVEVTGLTLHFGAEEASFSGSYGARLQNNEAFGVFNT